MSGETRIVDLPLDSVIGGSEEFPVTDSGTTKKISTNGMKNYVLSCLVESGTVSTMSGNDIFVNTESGIKRISMANFVDVLESALVSLTENQTVSGNKTFSGTVNVSAPTSDLHAATKKYVDDGLSAKVTAAVGKTLTTNDFTNELKTKLEGISAGAQVNSVTKVNEKTGDVSLDASDVGAAVQTPTFSKAETLAEPVGNNETSETLWGKVKKAVGDLIAHLADTNAHVTSLEKSSWNAKQSAITVDSVPTEDSKNPVASGGVHAALVGKVSTSSVKASFSVITSDSNVPSEKLVKTSLDAKQNAALVTSWQSTPDDTHYPSEKLVSDWLDIKQDSGNLVTSVRAAGSAENTKYPSELAVRTSLDAKQNLSALVTSWQQTPDNTHYPSEKLVKDCLNQKQATLTFDNEPTQGSSNMVTSGSVYAAIASGGSTIDPSPTSGSSNPVSSGGVYSALSGKQASLVFDTTPTASSSNPVTSGGVKGALDTKLDANKKVTSWNNPTDDQVASAKLVKDTIDGIQVSETDVLIDKTISTGDLTISVGSAKETFVNLTDGRTGSGTNYMLKVSNTFAANTVRRARIMFSSVQAGIISLGTQTGSPDNVFVVIDGSVSANKRINTAVNASYDIDFTIYNKSSRPTYVIKVTTLTATE